MAEELHTGHSTLPDWCPRGTPLADFAARLESLGFWEQLAGARTEQDRLDFLAGLLAQKAEGGSAAVLDATLTVTVRTLLERWLDEYREALNEDLARILLGEPPARQSKLNAAAKRFWNLTASR
jgi:hypothetical protein